MNGAEAILDVLKAAGVRRIFGVVGESVLDLTDAIRADSTVKYTPVRHEQAGALAASGYARRSRRPAVCLGHIGAGASNLVNGMADAYKDGVPVIAITGNAETPELGRDVWHEVDHMGMFEPVTEWNVRLTHVERVPQSMREAMTRLNTGPSGPIHIDLPKDVARAPLEEEQRAELTSAVDAVPPARPRSDRTAPQPDDVDAVIDRLRDADRPIVLAGPAASWSGAGDALKGFIETASVPLLTSLTARGVVDERHELCFGALGTLGRIAAKNVADDADFVLAVGSALTDIETFGYSLFQDAEIVQVHDDYRQLRRQYSVEHAVRADSQSFIRAVTDRLHDRVETPLPEHDDIAGYREVLANEIDAILDPGHEDCTNTDRGLVNPHAVLAALGERKAPRDVLCSASGKNTLWSSLLPISEPGTFLKSVGLGTMGFAFPAGIGAQLAAPESTVYVVIGDGDFSMTVQELETCVREELPVVVIVFNDRELSSIKVQQAQEYGGRFIGVDYTDVDFATVAEGMGAAGYRVESGDDVGPALDDALAQDGPAVIDITTDPDIKAPSLFYEQ